MAGDPVEVMLNLNIRSLGPISEMDMVRHTLFYLLFATCKL